MQNELHVKPEVGLCKYTYTLQLSTCGDWCMVKHWDMGLKSPTKWNTSSCIVCQVLLIPERALLPKPRTMVEIHFFVSLFLALYQWGWSRNRADEKKTKKQAHIFWTDQHDTSLEFFVPRRVMFFSSLFTFHYRAKKKHHLYSHIRKLTLFHGLQWCICSLPKAPPWGFVMTLPPWDLCIIFSKKNGKPRRGLAKTKTGRKRS